MPETLTSISFAKLEPKKDMPHLLVKQEVPAQGLNIELKSIKM